MTREIAQGDPGPDADPTPCAPEGSMDIPEKQHSSLNPLYRYKGVVAVQRMIDIVAETDEAFEEAVKELLMNDGIDPGTYEIVQIASDRTDALWS